MSLKKIDQVKKQDKGFKIWDILIYALIAFVIVALFIVMFTTRSTESLAGISVYYKDDVVFTYDFSDNTYEIVDGCHVTVEEESSSSLTIRFFVDEEDPDRDYNIIYIDADEVSVDVIEADCSQHKECFYMPAIVDTGSAIICSPHRMKIIPSGYEVESTGVQTG